MNSLVSCTRSWPVSLMPSTRWWDIQFSMFLTKALQWKPKTLTWTKTLFSDWKVCALCFNVLFVKYLHMPLWYLYIPIVCLSVVVIHWTRQIKELLSSQESLDTSTSSGPLEEIEFWRARCEDYSSLTRQLDQPGVKKVIRIVQRAKSSYVEPFQKLSRQIQVRCIHLIPTGFSFY